MIKWGFILGIVLMHVSVRAQYIPEFIKEARFQLTKKDTFTPLIFHTASMAEISYESDSTIKIEGILNSVLQKYNTNKKDKTLKKSQVLTDLSRITTFRIHGLSDAKKERIARIKKKLFRVFRVSKSPFGLISLYSISVPLVVSKGKFYHDFQGPNGGYNLYAGKKKPQPTKADPEPEITPLKLINEKEMEIILYRELRRSGVIKELSRGMVSYTGYYLIRDKKTMNRHKLPQVRIVLFFGSRRLHAIRIKN